MVYVQTSWHLLWYATEALNRVYVAAEGNPNCEPDEESEEDPSEVEDNQSDSEQGVVGTKATLDISMRDEDDLSDLSVLSDVVLAADLDTPSKSSEELKELRSLWTKGQDFGEGKLLQSYELFRATFLEVRVRMVSVRELTCVCRVRGQKDFAGTEGPISFRTG